MKTFITSDLHFGHANIMKFCPETRARFHNDVAYMNETMVKEWNELVGENDLTYILGDVAFCNAKQGTDYMRRLNGRKILIEGNHDRKILNDPSFRSCFVEVHKYHHITVDRTFVTMFHYPIAEWDQMHRGSVHFHGHLHGNKSGLEDYRALDVGMDSTGAIVIEMEDAIKRALKGAIKNHHQKGE
jgi:calcineurin-like phosphoesterase family protein